MIDREDFLNLFKDKLNILTLTITLGVLLMSLGIYLMGSDIAPFIGSRTVILGSAMFYISVVLLVFYL